MHWNIVLQHEQLLLLHSWQVVAVREQMTVSFAISKQADRFHKLNLGRSGAGRFFTKNPWFARGLICGFRIWVLGFRVYKV